MASTKNAMSPQVKALKTTDLTPFIRMAGVMTPRLLQGCLPCLDEKQRRAFNQVMPAGGEKKIYIHLVGTPTPPIVIGLAQPLKMGTLPEKEVRQQGIKGIRLTPDDLQLATGGQTLGNMLRLAWRLKGQLFTILGIAALFLPFLRLGPAELRDMANRMTKHFKPLFDLMPYSPKPTTRMAFR